MPASVNSYGIANGQPASSPILTRGAMKRLAIFIPAIASGSAHALTLEGYLGPVEGPASGISSNNSFWAPITYAATGSRMVFTTAGSLCLAFPADVVQAFDAVRLVGASAQLAALNLLVQAKVG